MKVVIKIDDVKPDQLAKIHELVDGARVYFGHEGKGGKSFIKVTKSTLVQNWYTIFLTIDTVVSERNDYIQRSAKASRGPLLAIFDSLGIFPEKEKMLKDY